LLIFQGGKWAAFWVAIGFPTDQSPVCGGRNEIGGIAASDVRIGISAFLHALTGKITFAKRGVGLRLTWKSGGF
jgi:hypothetical protein